MRASGPRPVPGVRGGAHRQRDDDRARARDRPGAAGSRPVHHGHSHLP
jgi:hypothetical protein